MLAPINFTNSGIKNQLDIIVSCSLLSIKLYDLLRETIGNGLPLNMEQEE